jgi:phosphate/sulfate permease
MLSATKFAICFFGVMAILSLQKWNIFLYIKQNIFIDPLISFLIAFFVEWSW